MSAIIKTFNIFAGDSFSTGEIDIDMAALLAEFAIEDLSTCTVSAALKESAKDSTIAISATIDDDTGTLHAFYIAQPVGIVMGTEKRKSYQLDIQIIDTPTATVVTVVRGTLNITWQADEVTA